MATTYEAFIAAKKHETETFLAAQCQAFEVFQVQKEDEQAEACRLANTADLALMTSHYEAMYRLFSQIITRALMLNNKPRVANSGSITTLYGRVPGGSFMNTWSDSFLKRMVEENKLCCISVTKKNKESGRSFKRHFYFVPGTILDHIIKESKLEEKDLKPYLMVQ